MKRRWLPSSKLISAFAFFALVFFVNSFSAHYFEIQLPNYLPQLFFFGILLIALVDICVSVRLPAVDIKRELPGNLAVDKWTSVTLRVHHHFNTPTSIRLFDGVTSTCDFQHLPLTLELQPNKTSQNEYLLRPLERGPMELAP